MVNEMLGYLSVKHVFRCLCRNSLSGYITVMEWSVLWYINRTSLVWGIMELYFSLSLLTTCTAVLLPCLMQGDYYKVWQILCNKLGLVITNDFFR